MYSRWVGQQVYDKVTGESLGQCTGVNDATVEVNGRTVQKASVTNNQWVAMQKRSRRAMQ